MTEALRKHFRNSLFIDYRTPERLNLFGEWLMDQVKLCDPEKELDRRQWLIDMARLAEEELTWRRNQATMLPEGES